MILADAAPPSAEEPPPRPVGAHRRGGPLGWAPPVPIPGQPTGGGVPRWRLAVVRQALLGLDADDPQALESLLSRLVLRLDGPEAAPPGSEAHWWAGRLLTDTLHRLPNAATYAPLLRALAARVVSSTTPGPTRPSARPRGAGGGRRRKAEAPGVLAPGAGCPGTVWSVPAATPGGLAAGAGEGVAGESWSDLPGLRNGGHAGAAAPNACEARAPGGAAAEAGAAGTFWSVSAAPQQGRERTTEVFGAGAHSGLATESGGGGASWPGIPGLPAGAERVTEAAGAGAPGGRGAAGAPGGLAGGGERQSVAQGGPFLPWDFWRSLPLTVEARLDVLRVLVRAGAEEPGRLLGEVVAREPGAALPPLCRWLADERLSGIAAETLFAHRHVALDELAEALVDAAHPRADALLRALAQAEPSALARAVDRWAHDPRPERHVAAATVLPLLARQAATASTAACATKGAAGAAAERTLLRLAAEALLAREDEASLHGAAYAALISDPAARPKRLREAVDRYLAGDPLLGAAALAPALDSDPALVLTGYAARLREPGEEAAAVLRALGATPAPRARTGAARLVREHLQRRPEAAAQVGGWLRARLGHGPAERETLLAFVRDAATEQPEPVRWRLAEALADLDCVLARELRALLRPAVTSPMRIPDQAHGKV